MLDVPPPSRASSLPQKNSAIPQVQALPPSRSGDDSQLKRRTLWEWACPRKRYVSHIDAGCAAAFASKPAPTKNSAIPRVQALPPSRSGDDSQLKRRTLWERACPRWRYVSHIDAGCAAAFASKLAPTKNSAIPQVQALPPSRSGDGSQLKRRTLWERACSRRRYVSHMDAGCAAVFASKPAPTGILLF